MGPLRSILTQPTSRKMCIYQFLYFTWSLYVLTHHTCPFLFPWVPKFTEGLNLPLSRPHSESRQNIRKNHFSPSTLTFFWGRLFNWLCGTLTSLPECTGAWAFNASPSSVLIHQWLSRFAFEMTREQKVQLGLEIYTFLNALKIISFYIKSNLINSLSLSKYSGFWGFGVFGLFCHFLEHCLF